MFCDILSRLKVTQLWEWKEKSKQQTGGADSLIKQNNKMYLAYMTTESWECLRIFEETKFPGLDQNSGNAGGYNTKRNGNKAQTEEHEELLHSEESDYEAVS